MSSANFSRMDYRLEKSNICIFLKDIQKTIDQSTDLEEYPKTERNLYVYLGRFSSHVLYEIETDNIPVSYIYNYMEELHDMLERLLSLYITSLCEITKRKKLNHLTVKLFRCYVCWIYINDNTYPLEETVQKCWEISINDITKLPFISSPI